MALGTMMALGAGLGGLAGGLFGSKPSVPQFVQPEDVKSFAGPLGIATKTGFDFSQDPSRQGAVDFANQQLLGGLQNVMQGFDPGRMQQFRDAFLGARRPELERSITQQAGQRRAGAAGQGLAGSSGAVLAEQAGQEGATRLREQLMNEAIMGGEALAQQDFAQRLQQLSAMGGLSQQDIGNMLNAFGATQGALQGQQSNALARAGMQNQLIGQTAAAQDAASGSRLKNIFGGIKAGAGLGGMDFSSFGNMFGGGGGVTGSAANPLGGRSFASAF